MDDKEKIRFIDEKRLARTIEKELQSPEHKPSCAPPRNIAATNPVKCAFLKFVQTKQKFMPKDF